MTGGIFEIVSQAAISRAFLFNSLLLQRRVEGSHWHKGSICLFWSPYLENLENIHLQIDVLQQKPEKATLSERILMAREHFSLFLVSRERVSSVVSSLSIIILKAIALQL